MTGRKSKSISGPGLRDDPTTANGVDTTHRLTPDEYC